MKRILLIEDEERIASFLQKGLKANGFTASTADNGTDGIVMLATSEFDLVILDIGLPDIDGFEVLRKIRKRDRTTPVIMLTARDGVEDTVAGLEGGADDYVTKPFKFEELLARIRVRLREERTVEKSVIEVGPAALDLKTRKVTVEGKAESLSAREFALAEMFFRHPGQVLSREQILSSVWGYDYDPGSNVVEVYVGYLRKKLGAQLIENVRGMGYRLRDET